MCGRIKNSKGVYVCVYIWYIYNIIYDTFIWYIWYILNSVAVPLKIEGWQSILDLICRKSIPVLRETHWFLPHQKDKCPIHSYQIIEIFTYSWLPPYKDSALFRFINHSKKIQLRKRLALQTHLINILEGMIALGLKWNNISVEIKKHKGMCSGNCLLNFQTPMTITSLNWLLNMFKLDDAECTTKLHQRGLKKTLLKS